VLGLPDRQKPPLSRPNVEIFDQPQLDILAARHQGLVTYYARDELLEAAKAYNQETALMVHQDDLTSRLSALAKQADTLDPDWRLDTFTEGDVTGTILRAKHPHAADRSPITLKMNATFGPHQEDLRQAFKRAIDYGTPERVDLPASVVSEFRVDGPEAFAGERESAEISLVSAEPDTIDKPFVLTLYDDQDLRTATFTGKTTWTGGAALGASLRCKFFDALDLEFIVPFDLESGGWMDANVSLAGCDPVDVVRAVDLLDALNESHSLSIAIGGEEYGRLVAGPAHALLNEAQDDLHRHREVARDFVVVQRETATHFLYPSTIAAMDRIYLRCLRLLVEGRCIVMPGYRELPQTLNGQDGDGLRDLLTGGPRTLVVEMDTFGFTVFGQEIRVADARMYGPQVEVVDAEDLLRALDDNDAAGMPLAFRAVEGYGIWVYIPSRYIAGEDDVVRPVSLGLAGYVDAPDIARALEPGD
jgi:hypothetical protein